MRRRPGSNPPRAFKRSTVADYQAIIDTRTEADSSRPASRFRRRAIPLHEHDFNMQGTQTGRTDSTRENHSNKPKQHKSVAMEKVQGNYIASGPFIRGVTATGRREGLGWFSILAQSPEELVDIWETLGMPKLDVSKIQTVMIGLANNFAPLEKD